MRKFYGVFVGFLVVVALIGAASVGQAGRGGTGGPKPTATPTPTPSPTSTPTPTPTPGPRTATQLMVHPPISASHTWCDHWNGCRPVTTTEMSATLTAVTGEPIADRLISLSSEGGTCWAITNAAGTGLCRPGFKEGVITVETAHGRFDGDAVYEPSEDTYP